MKNLILITILSITLFSCSNQKDNTLSPTTSSWNTNIQTWENVWNTNNTWSVENKKNDETNTQTWENLLPKNEMTNEAEKELSDELNSILESIEWTWEVK